MGAHDVARAGLAELPSGNRTYNLPIKSRSKVLTIAHIFYPFNDFER